VHGECYHNRRPEAGVRVMSRAEAGDLDLEASSPKPGATVRVEASARVRCA
jgi:hypothetical protein